MDKITAIGGCFLSLFGAINFFILGIRDGLIRKRIRASYLKPVYTGSKAVFFGIVFLALGVFFLAIGTHMFFHLVLLGNN